MKVLSFNLKRIGTILHYVGVTVEYCLIIFLGYCLDNVLKIPNICIYQFTVAGLGLILFGIYLIIWTTWFLIMKGKGTTGFSEPTKNLITFAPYRIVRNPMMEGQYIFFVGIGFLFNIITIFLILLILIITVHIFTVFVEEPKLKKRFGQEWVNYCKNVPRWIPKFKKTKKSTNIQ